MIEFKMNLSQLQKAVASTIQGMADSGALMEEIGEHMRSEIQIAMDAQESLDGDAWQAGRRDGQALRNTGKLYGAITYEATSDSVAVGVGKAAEDRYPEVHNEGMVIRPKNAKALKVPMPDGSFRLVRKVTIPKREFIPDFGKSPRAKSEIRQVCEEYMRRIMGL